jgi:sialate O-acetylesterase
MESFSHLHQLIHFSKLNMQKGMPKGEKLFKTFLFNSKGNFFKPFISISRLREIFSLNCIVQFITNPDSMKKRILFVLVLILPVPSFSQLKLASIFGDHMVLQRNKPIVVRGFHTPDAPVNIRLDTEQRSVRTNAQGIWEAIFPAKEVGAPFSMEVWDDDEKIEIGDLLMGEVWICSGQSNMEWKLERSLHAAEEIKSADYPNIRHLEIPKVLSFSPNQEFESKGWKLATPEHVGKFTAVGYHFARKLEADLKVPIGLIHASWGGTHVETWISHSGMIESSLFNKYAEEMPRNWEEDSIFWEIKTITLFHGNPDFPIDKIDNQSFLKPDFNADSWLTKDPSGQWDWKGISSFRGNAFIFRKINIEKSQINQLSTFRFGKNKSVFKLYVNGTLVQHSFFADHIQFLIPPNTFKEGENSLLIHFGENKALTKGYMGFDGGQQDFSLDFSSTKIPLMEKAWKIHPDWSAKRRYEKWMNNQGTLCYNGMISPIVGFPIAGVIWYQGESNTGRAHEYATSFPLLIQDWRGKWKDDFPFIYAQLSSFGPFNDSNSGSPWAELREAQLKTLSLPKTGMAVITDIGDPRDIHPLNKKDVGIRMALSAQKIAYDKNIVHSGPIFSKMSVVKNKALISFNHIGSGLTVQDKYGYLKGFEIAGADGVFYFASANIAENRVEVYHPMVPVPTMVRYGWSDSPVDANLFNKEGLPASPFRTDNLPGKTINSRFY